MKYILIGTLLGSFLHSEHETRESCEGRAVLLREKQASVQCQEFTSGIQYSTSTIGGCSLVYFNGKSACK